MPFIEYYSIHEYNTNEALSRKFLRSLRQYFDEPVPIAFPGQEQWQAENWLSIDGVQ
jgi:hypothetical protein